jgi:hypothetical protein
MLAPWKVAVITAVAVGIASALAQLDSGGLLVATGCSLVAGLTCLVTWFGLWISTRPNLALVPALGVVSASAIIAFLVSLPIKTHAELVDFPAIAGKQAYTMRSAYLVSLVGLGLPGLIAFVIGRAFGAPPDTSFERTRAK